MSGLVRRSLMAAAKRRASVSDPFWASVTARLKFDGDLTDYAGNTWTAFGGPALSNAGVFGQCLTLDGVNDWLTCSYQKSKFDWWSTDHTIELWVNPTDLATWSYTNGSAQVVPVAIANADASGINYWSFGPIADGRVRFFYYNGSGNLITSSATVIAGQQNYIAMKKTAAGVQISVNGTLMAAPVAIVGTPQSSESFPLSIGHPYAVWANGKVDDARITNGVARDISEVPTAPFPIS